MGTRQTTKNKAATPSAQTNGTIQDIPHEVVHDQPGQEPAAPAVIITVDDQIRQELKKFNVADSAIAEMKAQYGALVINGPDDKDGYKAVKAAWNDTRSKRTGLEKKGLEIRQGYTVITKAVKKEEDRLIELITPLEEDLYAKWKAIDDEKERAKKEQEEAEQAALMARVEEVMGLGMSFKDGFYQIGDTITVDVASLRAMPEDQYDKLKSAIQAKAQEIAAEKERQAEAERQRQAEFQRQQDELKRQQAEMEQQRQEMERQRQELENQKKQAAEHMAQIRTNKLAAIGLNYQRGTGNFAYDNGWSEPFSVPAVDLFSMDGARFDSWLDETAKLVNEKNAEKERHDQELKKEAEALDNKKKFIARAMETVGMRFSYTAQAFTWEDKNTALSVPFADLVPLTEADIMIRAQEIADTIAKAKKMTKENDDRQAAEQEKERQAQLGDKDRLAALISQLEQLMTTIDANAYKTKKYQQTASNLKSDLGHVLGTYKN